MRDYAEQIAELRLAAERKTIAEKTRDACRTAADAIEELLAELATIRNQLPRWVSVEERMPEINQSVLICVFGKSVGEGTYRGHDGFHHVWKMYAVAGTYWDDEVTHWVPLPEPPKGVE